MSRTMSFYDLSDALRRPGCAVCRLEADAAKRFLDSLMWESVNDPGKRRVLREARGFCRDHAWALVRPAASLGVAIIMRDVLHHILELMQGARFRASPLLSRRVRRMLGLNRSMAAGLAGRLAPRRACPACVWVEEVEEMILHALLENLLGEGGLLAAYEASDGLCLLHFCRVLDQVRDTAVFDALLGAQRLIWERLVAHLDESIRKSDHRFLDEAWGEEAGAWLRSIAALVGPRPGGPQPE